MDDLISRQAAIDALRKLREEDIEDYGCEIPEGFNQDHLDRATFAIKQLPLIQPKRGKWIYCEDSTADCVDGYRCDQCGFFVPWDYKHKGIDFIQDYNFCPNCGAEMEVTT